MRTKNKSGFTLVELMIVAAIIAILAAILIPLLSSNKDSAIAAEASNICGSVATEMKTIYARTGSWPTQTEMDAQTTLVNEINKGRYFTWADVSIVQGPNWSVTVSGDGSSGSANAQFSSTVGTAALTLAQGASGGPIYSGTMVTPHKLVSN